MLVTAKTAQSNSRFFFKPKTRFRMRKDYSTLALSQAFTRFLRFSASSTLAFVFTHRDVKSCT